MYDDERLERDDGNDNPEGLPTYGYLEEQERSNPNSRFGRWRGWIEKRAAERYADITPDDLVKRRKRGWGTGVDTNFLTESPLNAQPDAAGSSANVISPVSQPLEPTNLSLYQFGSRFLPHATDPIRTLVRLLDDQYLLIGTTEGLGMLELFPETESSESVDESMPHALEGAKRKDLWFGESVLQLDILESSPDKNGGLQGVVLALIGTEGEEQDKESTKSVRMYNLASLLSLVHYAASQKDYKPLELYGQKDWSHHSPRKLHRASANSVARGLKNMVLEHQVASHTSPVSSISSLKLSSSISSVPVRPLPHHMESTDSWDMVEELPLRWATDFVNLATPGSKLASSQVLFYELWKNDGYSYRGTTMLAVATKTNILLFETPKGERAFRFVKEFYTPLPARSINFVHKQYTDIPRPRTPVEGERLRKDRSSMKQNTDGPVIPPPRARRISTPGDITYGSQLSMFIIFERKAGLIRIADSSVGEMELWDDGGRPPSPSSHPRRSLSTLAFGKDTKGQWLPLAHVEVPIPPPPPSTPDENALPAPRLKVLVLLSRGRQTHILPSPLPIPLASFVPLKIIYWNMQPTQVTARVSFDPRIRQPRLQVVGFGDMGIEVAEFSLDFIFTNRQIDALVGKGKGKGKSLLVSTDPVVKARWDTPDTTGYLSNGGVWHLLGLAQNGKPVFKDPPPTGGLDPTLVRGLSQGIYGWSKKGLEDYRVFWLGDAAEQTVIPASTAQPIGPAYY